MSVLRLRVISASGVTYMYPSGIESLSKKGDKDTKDYRLSLKESIDGKLTFVGEDYDYFNRLQNSSYHCDRIDCQLQKKCGSNWVIQQEGTLKTSAMIFDDDKCTCVGSMYIPAPLQKYDDKKNIEYNAFDLTNVRYTADSTGIDGQIGNGLLVYDVLSELIFRTLGIREIKSDFFGWNPDDPNYTIGNSDKLKRLVIFQKSDVIRRGSGTFAWNMPLTLKELLNNLCVHCNLEYRIDTNNLFRIEHVSWWNRTVGLDVTQSKFDKFENKIDWAFLTDEYYNQESFSNPDNSNLDFVGKPILYDNECVTNTEEGQTLEHISTFSTDVQFLSLLDYTDDGVELDGIVMVAIDSNGVIQQDPPIFQVGQTPNNVLGWALLHDNFHRHKRLFINGNMNSQDVTFYSTRKFKKQENIKFDLCCSDKIEDYLDPFELVKTKVGDGELLSYQYDYATNICTISLLYDTTNDVVLTPPVAVEDNYYTELNTALDTLASALPALGDNDTNTASVFSETKETVYGGSITIFSNGHFQYTPKTGFYGLDEFTYGAQASNGNAAVGIAKIGVRYSSIYCTLVTQIIQTANVGGGVTTCYVRSVKWYKDAALTQPLNVSGYLFDIAIQYPSAPITYVPASGYETIIESCGAFVGFTLLTQSPYTVI